MRFKTRFLVCTMLTLGMGFLFAPTAKACIAMGEPSLKIIHLSNRPESPAGMLRAYAIVSEYDCFAMPPKTYCVVGIRLDPARAGQISVTEAKFLDMRSETELEGFHPKFNARTTSSFDHELQGKWFGFHSLFTKKPEQKGGIEIRFEFSYPRSMSDQQVKAVFETASVGISQGKEDGTVVKSHHFELVKVGEVRVL